MKHLDNFDMVAKRIAELDLCKILMPYELKDYNALNPSQREQKLRNICEKPIFDFSVINRLYFRLKWMDVLKAHGGNSLSLLEIGSGSSDNIPAALAVHDANSIYITANMNRELTRGLRECTSSLPILIRVIEDDAANIKSHLPQDSVDIVAFVHSVNDVLQAMLAEENGIDTSARDWLSAA